MSNSHKFLFFFSKLLSTTPCYAALFDLAGLFLNINCGSSNSIIDPITKLTWNPDTNYTSGGFTSTNVPAWPDYPQLDSLRYFNDSTIPKYCYQLPVITLSAYMVRTIFYYGNYDNLKTPPTFYLSIDGLIVANVSNTQTSAYYYEYTYQAVDNTTFLCLLRDSTKANPFISTIELRRILPYPALNTKQLEVGYVATTRTRLSFGAINTPRYVCTQLTHVKNFLIKSFLFCSQDSSITSARPLSIQYPKEHYAVTSTFSLETFQQEERWLKQHLNVDIWDVENLMFKYFDSTTSLH